MTVAKPMLQRMCGRCGAPFTVHPYRVSAKWCSKACWQQRSAILVCAACGISFKRHMDGKTRTVYCSQACKAHGQVGPSAPAWRDGASLKRERARHSRHLSEWRISVYRRDGFMCVRCGSKGKLHAHHIKPWATYPDLRFDVSNGITLCECCHGNEHGKDFSNRRKKSCTMCGCATSGRGSGHCHSCASVLMHAAHRAAVPIDAAQSSQGSGLSR
jgi:hypothetical protein